MKGLREDWVFYPATRCWIRMWVTADTPAQSPPPPGAAIRKWETRNH